MGDRSSSGLRTTAGGIVLGRYITDAHSAVTVAVPNGLRRSPRYHPTLSRSTLYPHPRHGPHRRHRRHYADWLVDSKSCTSVADHVLMPMPRRTSCSSPSRSRSWSSMPNARRVTRSSSRHSFPSWSSSTSSRASTAVQWFTSYVAHFRAGARANACLVLHHQLGRL
jgi:hypothetical protein